MIRVFLCAAALVLAISSARGQGLLAIGPKTGTEEAWPWMASLSAQAGWDSNPFATSRSNATPTQGGGSSSDQGTFYLQNDVNLTYSSADRINHLDLTADYSDIWYAHVQPGTEHFSNDWKVSANYTRQETRQVTIADSLYLAHQTQPDFSVGLTLNRPTNGSFVAYNNLSLTYAFSRVLSAVTSYTVTGVQYDDETYQSEDCVDHVIAEQLRYQMTRRTTGTFSLRYEITDYPHMETTSSNTVFALLGVEHQFSRFLQGSLSAGAEFRDYKGPLGSETAPSVEASLNYHMGKNTSWRWYASLGLNDTGSAGAQSGYSYQTGLSLSHQFTPRLSVGVAINADWTDYTRGITPQTPAFAQVPASLQALLPVQSPAPLPTPDQSQQTFSGSINFTYRLYRNVSLTAGYTYTDVTGQSTLVPAYDRQQVSIGLTATF